MPPPEQMSAARDRAVVAPTELRPAARRWHFQLTPGQAWDRMYEACADARTSIAFEQYILSDDVCGRRFADVLMERARRGVRVRVLCDMLGSLSFYNGALPDRMRAAGCDVRFYNPLSPWRMNHMPSWSRRDHRKIAVIDDRTAFVGGVCIDETMREWRDTHVGIEGPVVVEVRDAFDRLWDHVGGLGRRPVRRSIGLDDMAFLTNEPHIHRNPIYRQFLVAIARARHYIYLTTPYYVPDHRFFRHLRRARRRGVDVRLLMPETSDHYLVHLASRSYWGPALKAGIRVFAYRPTIIHSKTIVIDDRWSTVGSSNLDYLSFFGNQEGNLIATMPDFALDLKQQFLDDLEDAREVTLEEWKNRPFIEKVVGLIARPVKTLL
jgi:cardiolipin synthase A/B